MKVEVVGRKLIKPSIPTPENLNKYKLSLTDELSPPMNVPIILFYSISQDTQNYSERNSCLEESLAKILSQFYPFAGRYIKNDHLVDCSDQGAEFVEAQVVDDVHLLDFIAQVKPEQLSDLLPRDPCAVDDITDPLLSIQLTTFTYGGLAIGVSMSHRIVDAESLATLVAAWANANKYSEEEKFRISPSFDSPRLFPSKKMEIDLGIDVPRTRDPSTVAKRIVFNKEAVASLKAKTRSGGGSRVRVVCALIAKVLIGVDRARKREWRGCAIAQAVNIRERTIPPLAKHSCGNLAAQAVFKCEAASGINDMGFQDLFDKLGDAIHKTSADCARTLGDQGDGGHNILVDPVMNLIDTIVSDEMSVLFFSDWTKCRFYEVDFGWGKPIWTSIETMPGENLTVLMGDGIEAWVHLNQKDMPYLEQDEELKAFVALAFDSQRQSCEFKPIDAICR
ncbi:UNVERIFIED_CONTAM: Pelargonidin 3-O-(6-caffeoylglucoside) 5-O-(6-O-malonylglucoside) 4'''-malonyltransferase [Sesamum calycinum]|uniref:Pelargonidin 3-O-(6-caffeoylglucoside) 5-O-(6-O-malonylglucoside) 4'''-malonyltransferase n=1 Tax=Sesamum calycinum TaxID=2727403 RepID=A0AAW2RAT4_9LAMI